jgi:hypothetical protein
MAYTRYTREWESLPLTLKLVIGGSEDEVKADLCYAMRDKKIDVRVKVAASDPDLGGQYLTRSDGRVVVPLDLEPDDLDWTSSRPFKKWPTGPNRPDSYTSLIDWKPRSIDQINLFTADVIEVLCGGSNKAPSLPTPLPPTDEIQSPPSNEMVTTDAPEVRGENKSHIGVDEASLQSEQPPSQPTARDEQSTIKALASYLKSKPQSTRAKVTKKEAREWCKAHGYDLTSHGFQERVWPEARKQAQLPEKAKAGRKRKSS